MQIFNPYLPEGEYVPDGEPHVFGDRLYVFGSHDRAHGDKFCLNDYVGWSAPLSDLSDWRYDGVIYRADQDPHNKDVSMQLYAPDVVQGNDGKYYLYYSLSFSNYIDVAVCDTPTGKYEYLGDVHYEDGTPLGHRAEESGVFDPAVLNDNGRLWLYSGFSPNYYAFAKMLAKNQNREATDSDLDEAKRLFREYNRGIYCDDNGGCVYELLPDMLTVKEGKMCVPGVGNSKGTGFEGHEFFEASSIRRINGKYYFVYSSVQSHELCYAVSDRPDGHFKYGGTIISNADIGYEGRTFEDGICYFGNNHGGLVELNGQWYIFWHKQTNHTSYSRQGCADRVYIDKDGKIGQVKITSYGLNGKPLEGNGEYPAYIACILYGEGGVCDEDLSDHPKFTQCGEDGEEGAYQYIENIRNKAVFGFRYFDLSNGAKLSVKTRGDSGYLHVLDGLNGKEIATLVIRSSEDWNSFDSVDIKSGECTELVFEYEGKGAIDVKSICLK